MEIASPINLPSDGALFKLHQVLGESACLVREDILHLT